MSVQEGKRAVLEPNATLLLSEDAPLMHRTLGRLCSPQGAVSRPCSWRAGKRFILQTGTINQHRSISSGRISIATFSIRFGLFLFAHDQIRSPFTAYIIQRKDERRSGHSTSRKRRYRLLPPIYTIVFFLDGDGLGAYIGSGSWENVQVVGSGRGFGTKSGRGIEDGERVGGG